ncbi:MAG: endonuclease/exonuclease/phosphatase family protein [Planctomycetales bacterium]|nr:endonuclease/exonuclease/phosphatase family protein [Planctomycetales bacterium]
MSGRALGYSVVFLSLLSGSGWLFFQNFDVDGVNQLKIVRRAHTKAEPDTSVATVMQSSFDAPPKPEGELPAATVYQGRRAISIATFNMESFNQSKSRKPAVMDLYVRMLRRFDVVALQEIQSDTDDLLPRLVDQINSHGGRFDYVIGPRIGPQRMQEQLGFIFNQDAVDVDRSAFYSVDDHSNLLTREPLIGWFRTRGIKTDEAFTFSLVNVHVDPARTRDEIPVLRDLMFKVRDDGRGEDDVIMLGDFSEDYRKHEGLSHVRDLGWAVGEISTLTAGTAFVDNIAFQKTSTVEFTGRSGVFDFLREYNLPIEQALEVSDHMPVFAWFSVFEGGEPGRIAQR